jgi:dTDP-4-dehydrorhamnose reductase
MKILVVGSGGRLGGALVRLLGVGRDVVGLDHAALDLADRGAIEAALSAAEFDVLLTPAALTSVDYCEANPDEALLVNAEAPRLMAQIAASKGARMIHFSTDYVFDGREDSLRTENEPVSPLGAYGRSKAAGEAAVLAVSDEFLVARVSWIFGPDRPSFLDSIIRRAMSEDAVAAIADKYSTPTYSHDLAEMVGRLLEKPEISGLLHLCNSGACSWQRYGQAGLDAAHSAGIPLRAREVGAMTLAEMEFGAPRPQHTSMSVARYTELMGGEPRGWEEAVGDYVSQFSGSFSTD